MDTTLRQKTDTFAKPFFPEESKEKNVFIDILQSFVIAIALSIFLYLFIITPNEVEGVSMEPNLHTGDLLFTSKIHQWLGATPFGKSIGLDYQRGDVVVFQAPGRDDFVKRVIGLSGEKIRIEDGTYYINGKKFDEDFKIIVDIKKDDTFLVDGGAEKTIPDDSYFVSGDNREGSFDSRMIGFVKRDWIKGKVLVRFWPLDKLGIVSQGAYMLTDEPKTETSKVVAPSSTDINLDVEL